MIGSLLLAAVTLASAPVQPDLDAFREARFGLFVHWGLYAQLGGRYRGKSMEYIGEWIQSRYRIPNAEYSLLAKEFNPVRFDADEWAASAKAAGMEYVVFTTKHHEGFAMFATKASDYNIVDATPFKRDVFGELAAACRRHGLKVGLYYSQCLDWHEFDAADVVERRGTNRGNIKPPEPGMDWGNSWDWPDASRKDIRKYLKAKVYPQLKELLTNYGDIFLIWFDTAMGMTEEQTRELREYVRSLSPKTVVNSRIGFGLGDFGSMGDNQEMSGKSDFARECPVTLNDTWGFKYDDHNWKSAGRVAEILAQTVSCNANVLLNVGPRSDGTFPEPSRRVLAELAEWRTRTGFQIRGTKASPFSGALPWGWCTVADGNVLQFVVRNDWTNDLEVCGIRNRVKSCTVPFEQKGGVLTVRLTPTEDAMPRVVRVTLEGAPDIDRRILPQNGVMKLVPTEGVVASGKVTGKDDGFVGVDAVKTGGGACTISRNGAFASWHHSGDTISWRVVFPEAGRYRVWIRTENAHHSAPWAGDRKVRLTIGGMHVEKELTADRVLPSTVYARAETDFGLVDVPAGEGEISVENVASRGNANSHELTLVTLEAEAKTTAGSENGGTVAVDFSKAEGLIRPLNGVNNAPCLLGTNDCVASFRRAGIPFMRTHDTVGMWGGTHYVDIPNIFPDFDADETDPKNYDFTFSDRYLASVVCAGTEIFFRLGVTIENHWRIKRYTTNPPRDFAKWARICEHVIRHYNEGWANGYKWNIRYWEIWNEPDNPSMWSGTCEQFLDLYVTSATHLKKCFPNLKVGGFGSCGFYGINRKERSGAAGAEWGFFEGFLKWYDAFLARCRTDRVPLDFFSFHLYSDDPREHVIHTAYAQRKLDEYGFKETELVNDEWNSTSFADTWSNKGKAEAYGKETHESAAYVASVLAVMQRETTLSKAMFYDACPGRSYGTLFHANGKTTQAYEAFRAFDKLRQLGTSVGVTSSCSNVFALAAKDAAGRQRVMLANFTDRERTVALKLDAGARYLVSRVDERHSVLVPTGESVVSGETFVIPWKGLAYLEKIAVSPVKVIFDSDTHGDYDDVGALAVLHKYADAGLMEILGTFSCKPTGESVPVIETVNRYYGRAYLPTGAPKIANAPERRFGGYGLFPKYDGWFRHADAKDAPDAITEYRRILAAQPDKSVVICGVGTFTNFELLLRADPGLVAEKVKRLVVMACKCPGGKECNSATCPAATRYVLEHWPTPIEFCDYDFGRSVYSGRTVAEADPDGFNPVRDAYVNCLTPRRECFRWSWDRAEGHPSWDQTAVMLAVFGLAADGLWRAQRGRFEMMGDDGTNTWTEDPNGPHARIVEGDVSFGQLGEAIDGTMSLAPSEGR